jgi:PQQ-dependent dehydrogenase (methanol/ethanol family)
MCVISLGVLASAQTLKGTDPTGADFPLVGGSLSNQRHSSLTKIDKSNVKQLGAAWMVHVEPGKSGLWMQATPVVVDGIMYLAHGHITARDARTGELKWQYPKGDIGPGGAMIGGPDNHFNRGVVVGEGKVFSAANGTTLLALDQKSGELLWRTELKPGPGPSFANAAAVYYDGLVYMGIAGGEQGVRGQFGAYDAKTGKEVWKFWTVPGPGEFGHDTWDGDSWKTGGAPVWTHPAVDPELGMVYITTGNPWPDTDGSTRGGDNLFSASIVALDLMTGARKWHFQEVHHDLWDYDGPSPPVLADITYQGRPRKILMHGNKNGMMYILDRTNGTPLIGVEEKPVPQLAEQKTARTQPYSTGDSLVPLCVEGAPSWFPSGCVFTPFYMERVAVAPGSNGGLAWAPTSYSPQTKLLYACASIRANSYSTAGFGALPFTQVIGGVLSAIDPTTNKAVWQKRFPFQCGGGSGLLSTATGLLFHGQGDGLLVAHDAATGDVLWSFQTGAGADAPVATYEVDGEQYVAILAGGNQYMGTAPGDNLWAFKLGGTLPPLPAPRPPAGTAPVPPVIQVAPSVLETYVGTYQLQANQNLIVTLDNGKLMLQLGGGPPLQMYATSETTFFTLTPNLVIQVQKDASGTVTQLGVRQGRPGAAANTPEMKAVRK